MQRTNPFYQLSENDYYISRQPTNKIDYEASYWDIVTDPDGKVRDRSKERDHYLSCITTVRLEVE